jgi:2-polyprenyl-6-hydroxyphenyl methylase/3-demethylubiquinone-9 3-methyltransferase
MTVAQHSNAVNADPAEVGKFDALASRWWDPHGDFKPLHQLNPVRLAFVAERVELAGASVLDVGCGGGILSESLARAGAKVTGIDMADNVLTVARLHQQVSNLPDIRYAHSSAEQLAATETGRYDVVTCMEVLEHVPDPVSLIGACARLARPGGNLFFSTLNRTPKAYLLAILGAEYVLSMLPKGTHEYAKFIRPSELRRWGAGAGLDFAAIAGLTFSPLNQHFSLTDDVGVNYLMHFRVPD